VCPFTWTSYWRSWYSHQKLRVMKGRVKSSASGMSNGIRQGFIIIPYLLNVYVNDLNKMLNNSGLGCCIGEKPSNHFSCVDDIALLAPTARGLKRMIAICAEFAISSLMGFSLILVMRCHISVPTNI